MRLLSTRLVACASAGAVMASIGLAGSGTALAATGDTPVTIYGSGSDTTVTMMQALDVLYNSAKGCGVIAASGTTQPKNGACVDNTTGPNTAHDQVVEDAAVGSGNGLLELCQQGLAGVHEVEFARASRAPKAADCDGLTGVAYAQDAVTWYHFTKAVTNDGSGGYTEGADSASADVHNLTKAQLQTIYTANENAAGNPLKSDGTTPYTWSDFGGANTTTPIVVYTAQSGSGTQGTFKSLINGNDPNAKIPAALNLNPGTSGTHVLEENNAQQIIDQGNTSGAIYFYSYGKFTAKHAATNKLDTTDGEIPSVEGIATNETNIVNLTAPGYRKVYNVYRYATPQTLNYIGAAGYLCSTGRGADDAADANSAVNQTIRAQGFIPFVKGTTGQIAGTSYCRVGATDVVPDTTAPSAAPGAIATGGDTSAVVFSEPVKGDIANLLGLKVKNGATVGSTVSCLDLQLRTTSCSSAAGVKAALVKATGAFAAGTTYTSFVNAGLTDLAGNPLPAASADFASPFVAPVVNTVTTTVVKLISTPIASVFGGSASGSSVKIPVSCANTACVGTIKLTSGGKTVGTGTYNVAAGSAKTITVKLNSTGTKLKKALKKGKKLSVKVALTKGAGQVLLGKSSFSVAV